MITQTQIDEHCLWPPLRKFGAFVLEHADPDRGSGLPDYEQMDLMRVPNLVPYIWVYDLRTPERREGLYVNFAGSKHDEVLERPTMGLYDAELPSIGVLLDRTVVEVKKAIEAQTVLYSRKDFAVMSGADRTDRDAVLGLLPEKKFRYSEALFFPCSSDGETVNWSIAAADFQMRERTEEDVFIHF
ncbi:MAG: hypothetical protein RIC16_14855 [Rhodospirillales bacterium]